MNPIAYDLYAAVTCGWIFGALFWILTVISALMHFLTAKFCRKPGATTSFVKNKNIYNNR